MNLSSLIARAVEQSLREHSNAIGVSLSPVGLTANELRDAATATKKLLGAAVRVVGSAPGVRLTEANGLFIAPDQRAAERATEWRNSVDVGGAEHLVYISVEEHPKASGLRDCLLPTTEADIVRAFMDWSKTSESPLPKDFAERLEEAGLVDRVAVSDLCDLAAAVSKEKSRVPRWQAVGKHLPHLSLVRDSKLGGTDTALRLSNNKELVTALLTGERRKSRESAKPTDAERDLVTALGSGIDFRDALASVDIGDVATAKIDPKPAKKRSNGKTRADGKKAIEPKRGKTSPKPKAAANGRERGASGVQEDRRPSYRPSAPTQPSAPEEEHVEVSVRVDVGGGGAERPFRPSRKTADASGSTAPVEFKIRVSVEPLPRGLGALLEELLNPTNASVEVVVREAGRGVFQTLSRDAMIRSVPVGAAETECASAFSEWRRARATLLEGIRTSRGSQDAGPLFVRALPELLNHEPLRVAAESLARASEALFRQSIGRSDAAMQDVLSLDTISVTDGSRVALRALGPLHLLALGQTLARSRLADDVAKLPVALRRVAERAMQFGLTAPASLPVGATDQLTLSRAEEGLLVFERVPELVDRQSLQTLGYALVRRFVELSPHALLGVRLAVIGAGAAELAEGVARFLDEEEALRRVDIHCGSPPTLRPRSAAIPAIEAGRLSFQAIAEGVTTESGNPHIVVYTPAGVASPESEEPAWSSPSGFASSLGGERASFEVGEHGLRVRTSVVGVSELEAFDLVHSRLRDRVPTATFTVNAAALGLSSVMDIKSGAQTTWHTVIGPNLGRRPPMGSYLLAYEALDERSTCAIISKDMRPAISVVRRGLERVGIVEQRPGILRDLASKLASVSRSGLISLNRDDGELLASALLVAELRRTGTGDGALVAHVTGRSRAILLGDHEAEFSGVLALSIEELAGKLKLTLGFATLESSTDADVTSSRLGGRLGEQLEHVVSTLALGATTQGLGAAVAREALGWSLWPAVAAHEGGAPAGWGERLRRAIAGPVDLALLVMLPPQLAPVKGRLPKVGKTVPRYVVLDRALVQRTFMT